MPRITIYLVRVIREYLIPMHHYLPRRKLQASDDQDMATLCSPPRLCTQRFLQIYKQNTIPINLVQMTYETT